MSHKSIFLTVFTAVLAATLGITSSSSHAGKAGCEYKAIDIDKYGQGEFQNPPSRTSTLRELDVTLEVKYATHEIAGCAVHHRSYNGKLVGPTLRVKPGDTMNVHLKNLLPPNPDMIPRDHNVPHDFNTTNLHTHGLHVSPAANSDNVLLRIEPGDDFQFEIKVPKDHPPGTFWYHAHVHGSTAIQVSSGMAGALIVEGGLDEVPEIAQAKEQILLFQQISYDEEGQIENFYEIFGPGTWDKHKRQTTINGQIVPVIRMRPGEVQRWRLIHGGIRETIMVQLEGHELTEIAVDGIALGKCDTWQQVELQPGYRSDVLVKANPLPPGETSQEYWLLDAETSPKLSLLAVTEQRKVLAKVVVEGEPKDMKLPCAPGELANLIPLEPIKDEEISGHQRVAFSVAPVEGGVAFTVNGRPFDLDHVRKLKLGGADEWTLETAADSLAPNHPFHIHVNPFQHTRTGPDGRPETIWRDTLIVRKGKPETIRSRYTRYIGKFVLHCHILDHEDQGMMEVVEIVN